MANNLRPLTAELLGKLTNDIKKKSDVALHCISEKIKAGTRKEDAEKNGRLDDVNFWGGKIAAYNEILSIFDK